MTKRSIDKIVAAARKRWAIDSSWEITWEFSENARAAGGAFIDPSYFTERRAKVELDESLCQTDPLRLKRNIYHELGHIVVAPIWRGVSDWADHTLKSKRLRTIFEEQVNTRENEVIDHIVSQIFKI